MSDGLGCSTGENTDHVHRYVAGTLPPEELEEFEVHLLECPDCRRAVRQGAAIRTALETSPGQRRGTSGRRRLVWAVPLVAAAAVAGWLLLPAGDGLERLGQVGSAPDLVRLPVRAEADFAAVLADRGMAAYQRGDYGTAAGLLAQATATDGSPGLRFFLGIARLMNGSPDEAVASLEDALEPAGNPYAAEAHFYLAKAWLQMGRADSSLVHLAAVPRSSAAIRARAEALADSVRAVVR